MAYVERRTYGMAATLAILPVLCGCGSTHATPAADAAPPRREAAAAGADTSMEAAHDAGASGSFRWP
jgi:hypothetical protein